MKQSVFLHNVIFVVLFKFYCLFVILLLSKSFGFIYIMSKILNDRSVFHNCKNIWSRNLGHHKLHFIKLLLTRRHFSRMPTAHFPASRGVGVRVGCARTVRSQTRTCLGDRNGPGHLHMSRIGGSHDGWEPEPGLDVPMSPVTDQCKHG